MHKKIISRIEKGCKNCITSHKVTGKQKNNEQRGGRVTDAGTDCVPSPQPQTRKDRGEREKNKERGREQKFWSIYTWGVLGLLWHNWCLAPLKAICNCPIVCFTLLLLASIGALAPCRLSQVSNDSIFQYLVAIV